MPYGYLVSIVILAFGTLAALAPVPYRYPVVGKLGFVTGLVVNELPFLALTLLAGSTALAFAEGDIASAGSWAVVGLAALIPAGLVVVARRSLGAPGIVRAALAEALGAGATGGLRRTPWASILLRPLWVHRLDVRRVRNLAYGPAGRRNRLDVYRSRAAGGATETAPVIVYFHGGGYYSGSKNREGRLMLYRLAAGGFVGVSANYRLRPRADFADHLADVERVLAWVRTHIAEHGGDPDRVIVAGSSAGAHLAAITALTPADTSTPDAPVTTRPLAAVCLYGYYGYYYGTGPADLPVSSPLGYAADAAPPVFVAHGDRDPMVPVEAAREFVAHLRSASPNPVVYAELPGAQHAFDLFRSVRHEAVIDGVEAFAAAVARPTARQPEVITSSPRV
ncbi:alpha/beta hydrolase [Jiangella mangrovi]|uniref:Acetyl esterase/lipase n=1 Tax=Jiangella mangrovi TaxID=1524084 RepID=A0A7W9GSX9_9ACTN|nr:alpha/beta hydrolase [Jiangella mangrovi]MBB5789126.1 acetyl esterase/lipase [Jiangella mangrovi]